jgi:hypothetical protein
MRSPFAWRSRHRSEVSSVTWTFVVTKRGGVQTASPELTLQMLLTATSPARHDQHDAE